MMYTNLYIVFKKIKKGKHPVLPGVSEVDYSRPEKELNAIIEQGITKVAQEAQSVDTTYITIFENGTYRLSKSRNANGYMKLLFYGGYKYLFFEYGEYAVLINYSKENEDICYRGDIHTWEYLPEKERLYKRIGEFYMVNSYNAFCNYAEKYKGGLPNKTLNEEFFSDAQEVLLTYSGIFAVLDGQVGYKGKKGIPQTITASKECTDGILSFIYLILDQLIIIADCSYSLKGINVTVTKIE